MVKLAALLCFGVFTFSVNAQVKEDIKSRIKSVDNNSQPLRQKVHSGQGTNSIQPVTISKYAGQQQVVHDNSYYQNEIAKINEHLLAIDQKIAYMNADPNRQADAQANGWFIQMDDIKSKLKAKKTLFQSKLTN
ncbi:MAG: hypothetical protein MK105_00855 [Crocinitomicaceae bacterium]|nr:hypothetical protein [Crocinitomicaceae bacterium]